MELKKATRTGVKPLIGIYGESGTGKSMTALLLARGLVGPNGRIAMIDSESGRGSLYADVIPGGYDVLELKEPFAPSRYVEAIRIVEESGAGVLIIDSASHEHEGIGGVLDMAAQNEERSGKAGLHNWKAPKMEHAKFMLKLLQSPLPIIVCLRAKYKTRQTKEGGKTIIVKDEKTSPIQSEDFVFEMTAHAEILQNHTIILTKVSHPELRKCFPGDQTVPISIEHGEALARWCNGSSSPSSGTSTTKQADLTPLQAVKTILWKLMAPVNKGPDGKVPKDWSVIHQILWREDILDPANVDQVLDKMDVPAIEALISKIKSKPEILQ